jgi:hypothetical protein
VKNVNYKLSTLAYLKLDRTNVFITFFSIHSLTPTCVPLQHVRADSHVHLRRSADTGERPRRPADASLRPRLYNPHPHSSFSLFLSFAFGWSCGICLATPISTCKGRRGHKHFEGDPLAFFAKQISRVVFTLLVLVFSVMQVFM